MVVAMVWLAAVWLRLDEDAEMLAAFKSVPLEEMMGGAKGSVGGGAVVEVVVVASGRRWR